MSWARWNVCSEMLLSGSQSLMLFRVAFDWATCSAVTLVVAWKFCVFTWSRL